MQGAKIHLLYDEGILTTVSFIASTEHDGCQCNCTHYRHEDNTTILESTPLMTTVSAVEEIQSYNDNTQVPYRGCGLQIHTG